MEYDPADVCAQSVKGGMGPVSLPVIMVPVPRRGMLTLQLKSGNKMPVLGLGTWQLTGDECTNSVIMALELGYRHIDTAEGYGNHEQVRAGIEKSGVKREELFITSKVSHSNLRRADVLAACDKALKELRTDYLDLYLVHWPNSSIPMEETLGAMSELVDAGKVRDIGVSNFTISHMEEAARVSPKPISVNQVEYHAYLNQEDLLAKCNELGVVLTAYSPLARGELLNDAVLEGIAAAHGKTVAQIALRWLVQKGVVVIPKARSRKHLSDNMNIFDFELTDEEMARIDTIETTKRLINPPWAEFDRS